MSSPVIGLIFGTHPSRPGSLRMRFRQEDLDQVGRELVAHGLEVSPMIMASAAPLWADLIVSAVSGVGTSLAVSVARVVESLTQDGKVQVELIGRTADGQEVRVSGNDPAQVRQLLSELLAQAENDEGYGG